MQQAVAFMVTLRHANAASEFETAVRNQIEKARSSSNAEAWQFQLFRGETPAHYVFVAQFPVGEFDRVSRAGWPFVLLAIAHVVTEGMKPFASDIHCVSGEVAAPGKLVAHWNEQFGRFTKLSFDAKEQAASDTARTAQ